MPNSQRDFSPIPFRCVRHTYYYYPFDWTDEESGKEYKRGYYDEDGCYYEDVAFLSNGRYENILCQCEYCDTVSKLDWSDDGPLICPQCGGSLRILSALDEFIGAPVMKAVPQNTHNADRAIERRSTPAAEYHKKVDRGSDEDSNDDFSGPHSGRGIAVFLVIILCMAMLIIKSLPRNQKTTSLVNHHNNEPGYVQSGDNLWIGYSHSELIDGEWMLVSSHTHSDSSYSSRKSDTYYSVSNSKLFGSVIYLKSIGDGICVEAREEDSDRKLVWNIGLQCYYNEESKVYIWYNTDMAPPVWQYWYEPISGDFGEYGWMEYDYENEDWRIQNEEGKWTTVPEKYDLTTLWRIDGLSASPEDYIEEQTDTTEGIVTSEADDTTEVDNTTGENDAPTENNSSWYDDTPEEFGSSTNTKAETDEDLG